MIKYDNLYLALLKVLLPIILILLSMYYLFTINPSSHLFGIVIYFILLSYFLYNLYNLKYIIFSKAKLGEELIIFSNKRSLNYKNIIFWAVVISVTYAKLLNNISSEIINSEVLYFSVILLVIIINFVFLFQSVITSSEGMYKEGVLIRKFIKWEEIIGYKTIKNKIYIKIKNKSFGFENNYLLPIPNNVDTVKVKNLLKENISTTVKI